MPKTKRRTSLKRRTTRKNNRRRKSFRNRKNFRKMIGGAEGECPVCLMEKPLFKMKHTLDANTSEEKEATIDHEMCEECFMHLNQKKCPLCRRNVEQLINTDDNSVVWPEPIRGPPNITELMTTLLGDMPVSPRPPWTYGTWKKFIRDNGSPYIQQFYDRLSELSDEELINFYKSSYNYNPIIFKDLVEDFVNYSNKRGIKHKAINFKKSFNNVDVIKNFLAHILVIEVVLGQDNYFNRIREMLGW